MAQKKTILLVDDEPDYVAVMKKQLEKEGYAVETAYNGQEGWEKIEKKPPDAVILDVMMPERDGYDLCSSLKEHKKYASIPVILLTAVASRVPSTRYTHYDGMTMEADDYLPKPASIDQLTQSLQRLLKEK